MERTSRPKARLSAFAGVAAIAALAFPAMASANVTSADAGGVLTVNGQADDAIAITCVGNQVKVNGNDPTGGAANCTAVTSIDVTGGDGISNINLAGVTAADPNVDTDYPNVTDVVIKGAGG